MTKATKLTRHEARLVATAAALVFTRVFGLSLVLPGFRAHGETLTSSAVLVGTALGAYGLTLALMQLPMGILSDRIGRRPVLLLGTLLFVAGSAWAALADSIGTLVAARLVQGLGAVSSTAMAAVGEAVPEARRTTAMAAVGVPAGVGFLLGLVAGPLLSPHVGGVTGLFWVTAALGLAAGLPVLGLRFAPPGAAAPPLGDRRSLRLPVLGLAAAGFATNYALTTVLFFLPGVARWTLAGILGAAFVVMAVASKATDRRGLGWQPVVLSLAALAGAAPVFTGGAGAFLVAGGVLFFASHAVLSAVLPSQVSRLAGRSGGRGHGVQTVVAYLGTFAAGPVAGAFADRPAVAFALLGVAAAAAAALAVAGLRRVGRTPRPAPAAG